MDLLKLPTLDRTSAALIITSQPLAFTAIRKTGVTYRKSASKHEALL
jgi:hypothetical protein